MSHLRHRSELEASRTNEHTCVYCETKFSHLVRAVGVGEAREPVFFGSGAANARQQAANDLERDLQRVRPVRCPKCDDFQPDMHKTVRVEVLMPAFLLAAAIAILATLALVFFGSGPIWGNEIVWVAVPASCAAFAGTLYLFAGLLVNVKSPSVKRRFPVGVAQEALGSA